MALGRALQHGADPRLEVGALAPIGGPFKPSLLVAKALNDEIANGVAYMAYWTVAWNRLFHLYDSPAEVFRDPSIEALFDGEHRNEDIFPRLPATMRELLTDSYFARLQHPTGVLEAKLREADGTCDWRPEVPVTLYSSAGDRDTLLETSAYCDRRLEQRHARSTLVDLGADVNHGRAVKLALPRILADFDRARKGKRGGGQALRPAPTTENPQWASPRYASRTRWSARSECPGPSRVVLPRSIT